MEVSDLESEHIERSKPRNLSASFFLSEQEKQRVAAIILRTHPGAPHIMEIGEGEPRQCWIYDTEWREIGTIPVSVAERL